MAVPSFTQAAQNGRAKKKGGRDIWNRVPFKGSFKGFLKDSMRDLAFGAGP